MVSKKGQGLSLNVIIVAALALIVLVVLIMVFTGRIGIFEKGVGQESDAELIKMKINYGDCHPSATDEVTFTTSFAQSESVEAKELAKADFIDRISECKVFSDKDSCEANGCRWS